MAQREQIDILFKMHADLKDMKRLQQETTKSKKQLEGIARTLKGGLGTAIGITSFGALTVAVKQSTLAQIEHGAALHDNAKLYGVNAEFLQTWRYASEQENVQLAQADLGLQRYTRRLAEARKGKGELLPVIKEYNIQLEDSSGRARTNVEVMSDFANLLRDTKDPAERLRIAFKLFDSEGAKLANVLVRGQEGLDAINEEMRETNKLISDENVAALKRASDAMTSFGAEMQTVFANATADVWTTIEAINYLAQVAEDDNELRKQAVANLAGIDYDSLPNSERARNRELEKARNVAGLTDEQILAEMERIRIERIREEIRVRREKLAEIQKEEAAIAATAAEEERRQALEKQGAELTAAIAAHEEQLRYERLDIEEKLAYQLARRTELEKTLQETALTEEDRVAKLKEYEDALKRILELELKIDAAKNKPSVGGEGGRTAADPLQSFADRMADAQNPQLVILSGMEAMYESINQQVQDLINGTITWEQALRNVGGSVLSAVIATFAQMAAAALTSYIVTQLGIQAIQKTAMAETMTLGATAAASWIPAAIAASIATMGAAAGVGAISFTLAMLAGAASASLAAGLAGFGMAALGGAGTAAGTPGFAEGGLFRGRPGRDNNFIRVSDEEFMMRPEATRFWGPDFMDEVNALRMPQMPAARTRQSGGVSSGRSRPQQLNHKTVIVDDNINRIQDELERQRGDLQLIKRNLRMA